MSARDDLRAAAVEIARRTAREQGLPEKVEDPEVLGRIARLIRRAPTPEHADTRSSHGHRTA